MYQIGLSTALRDVQNGNIPKDKKTADAQLKKIALDFEATLTSAILKEGLKSADSINDNEDKGSETFKNFAYEQMANYVGRQGILGIADSIVNSINGK